MMSYYVYMLRCSDGSLYTGITNNPERRIVEHNEGRDPSCYTFKRRPVTLVYRAVFHNVHSAISWEKTLKGWSRAKKEALIRGDQEALKRYAKNGMVRRIRYIREKTHRDVMVSTDEP